MHSMRYVSNAMHTSLDSIVTATADVFCQQAVFVTTVLTGRSIFAVLAMCEPAGVGDAGELHVLSKQFVLLICRLGDRKCKCTVLICTRRCVWGFWPMQVIWYRKLLGTEVQRAVLCGSWSLRKLTCAQKCESCVLCNFIPFCPGEHQYGACECARMCLLYRFTCARL